MGLDVGGAETHVIGLCRSLKERGWDVEAASSGGRRVRDLDASGIVHHHMPLASRNPFEMLRAHRLLDKLLKERRFDIIHAHARIPAWISTLVAGKYGIPLVTTYHWTFVSGFPWNYVTRAGDYTIAVSDAVKKYVVDKFGFDENKVTVIGNGIDCEEFSPPTPGEALELKKRFGLDPDKPVISYQSRLPKDLAAVAIAVIEAVGLLDCQLLVAGDGDYLSQVKEAASKINGQGNPRVHCLGFVSDMASVYRASDLVVSMSRGAFEAMACGKPVIVAGPDGDYGLATPENVEVLELRNFTSFDAPKPNDPATLAAEIKEGLDPETAARLSAFGLDLVREHHSVESTTAAVEEVYRKLLQR